MQKQPDWIVIGQFGRVHGIHGAIRLHSFTEAPDEILKYKAWHIYQNEQWVPAERLSEEVTVKGIFVKLKSYETREIAAQLTHTKVGVKQSQLKSLDDTEFYCFELVGMNVVTTTGKLLGQVTDVLPTGANDVLVIQGEKRHLLPYLPDRVIKRVNREAHEILVDWDDEF